MIYTVKVYWLSHFQALRDGRATPTLIGTHETHWRWRAHWWKLTKGGHFSIAGYSYVDLDCRDGAGIPAELIQ